jgi:hypothetical protein
LGDGQDFLACDFAGFGRAHAQIVADEVLGRVKHAVTTA